MLFPQSTFFFSFFLFPWPFVLSEDHPVLVDTEFDWYCRDKAGKYWWPGQKIDQDCYSYVCDRGQGIKRSWTMEIKSHCCARGGVAYLDGDEILKKTEGCVETRETCSLEDGAGVVIRTITNNCCEGGEGKVNQTSQDISVQWLNFVHKTGSFLDIGPNGEISLREGGNNLDSQKWRLDNGVLMNKQTEGKGMGFDESGKLSMVDQSSIGLITSLVFENGGFQSEDTSHNVQVASNGDLFWTHSIAKRQTIDLGILGTLDVDIPDFIMYFADDVHCPELLGWPVFEPFQEIPINTQCWKENQPSYRLYHGTQNAIIADSPEHLEIIQQPSGIDITNINKLVVLIHGYNAAADSWPAVMAEKLINLPDDLYVLAVDWSKGAFPSVPPYTPAAANTRYVGVATERVVRQLNPKFIHCIGHSLGAHTCGFFGNAIVADNFYLKKSLDRITGMDPAGPNWYDGGINAPLDEKLDKTDADLVDAIHTDTDLLGARYYLAHTDFYVGKNTDELGEDQFGSGISPADDHGVSYELMIYSIDHPSDCWAHFPCHGEQTVKDCKVPDTCPQYPHTQYSPFPHTYAPECKSLLSPRPHFGYWYDGKQPGQYGIVLTSKTCWSCVGDEECSGAEDKCDTKTHKCVSAECLRDHHCSSGQTCVNNKCDPPKPPCPGGRRKRQADQAQCSSEPSEQCKQKAGYCGNPSSCPGTVLDNLCPGGQDNKCCVGMPFQEEKCEAAGGVCGDR